MERAPLRAELSPMQALVCDFLGMGMSYAGLAVELKISPDMVRVHTKRAAAKIPGDLPAQMRCIAWARGATLDVLKGLSLRFDVQEKARLRRPVPTVGMLRQPHVSP